jgi:hypothetical protein
MGDPPSEAGAVQETETDPRPGVATTAAGAPGLVILVLADPCSINVVPGLEPTAQQSEELMQDTPKRLSVSGVLGVLAMDHALPFQCSANVRCIEGRTK